MDYKLYYCAQARSNQSGSGLPIQGINQLEPSNLEFLPEKSTSVRNTKQNFKVIKTKVSGLRRKPKQKVRKTIKRKISRKIKRIKKSKPSKKSTQRKKLTTKTRKSKKTKRNSKSKSFDIFM